MATINLGAIKFNWKGAYNSGTTYAVDDVASSGGNSYVCIQAHSNQAVGNATAYWNIMSSAGTNGTNGSDGTDVGTTITTQGDLLYRDGSGLQRLGAGTSGQVLQTGGASANPSWTTMSSDVVKLATINYTANNSNTVSIDGFFTSDYNYYELIIHRCQSPHWLKTRVNVSGTANNDSYYSNNNYYLRSGATSQGQWGTNDDDAFFGPTYWANNTNPYGAFRIQIYDPLATDRGKYIGMSAQFERSGTNEFYSMGGGTWQDNSAISGITLFNETTGSNMEKLQGALYGYKS